MYIDKVIRRVVLSRAVEKRLRKVPRHIAVKLLAGVEAVEEEGLEEVRKVPGYHDEPLRGKRSGERSIRLSRKWRAVYVIVGEDQIEFVRVQEVHAHDY